MTAFGPISVIFRAENVTSIWEIKRSRLEEAGGITSNIMWKNSTLQGETIIYFITSIHVTPPGIVRVYFEGEVFSRHRGFFGKNSMDLQGVFPIRSL